MPPERISHDTSPKSTPSRLPACQRCRSRKTKCDNKLPQCSPCAKAKVDCIGFDPTINRSIGRSYVLELEEKIKSLEAAALSSNKDEQRQYTQTPQNHHQMSPVHPQYSPRTDHGLHRSFQTSNLHISSRHYGPPSLLQYIQRLPGFETDSLANPWTAPDTTPTKRPPPPSISYVNQVELLELLPDRPTVDSLVEHFLDHTNAAFPIIHAVELTHQIDRIFSTPFTASTEDIYVVLAVLAVAACTMSKSLHNTSELRHASQRFWLRAQNYAEDAFAAPGIRRLQYILLHLQYTMHNPDSDSVWEVSGAAMRVAIDLGLHHETDRQSKLDPLELDLRRRLFWCSYCIDRNLATALGRPPSISDEWISAKFPAIVDDSLITRQGIANGPPSPRKLSASHQCKLRLIQTDIQNKLYTASASKRDRPPPEWFAEMKFRLEEWRATAPKPMLLLSNEWYTLNKFLGDLLLFRPCPGNPKPRLSELEEAMQAATGVIQMFKTTLRMGRINYVWLSIHHLFISGITYLNTLNALWEKGGPGVVKCPTLVDAILDIQTCSSLLEALTTTETSLTGIRDAFEKVSGAVIRRLSGDSSHANFHLGQPQENIRTGNFQRTNIPLMSPAASVHDNNESSSTLPLPYKTPDNDLHRTDNTNIDDNNNNSNTSNNDIHQQQQYRAPPIQQSISNNTFAPPALDINLMDNFLFHPITGFNTKSLDPFDIGEVTDQTATSTTSWM